MNRGTDCSAVSSQGPIKGCSTQNVRCERVWILTADTEAWSSLPSSQDACSSCCGCLEASRRGEKESNFKPSVQTHFPVSPVKQFYKRFSLTRGWNNNGTIASEAATLHYSIDCNSTIQLFSCFFLCVNTVRTHTSGWRLLQSENGCLRGPDLILATFENRQRDTER